MTWVAVAIVGAGVIGAVGSNMAADKQANAQKAAANTQWQMFNTIKGQEQPFLSGGYGAESALNKLLGTSQGSFGGLPNGYLTQTFNPTMADLQKYPGYQFALQQGGQALENQNTPGVGALSGAALKSLMSFNQGLASTQYQNAFNNFQTQQNNIFNRLSSIASLGQNAAGNLGNSGTTLGTGIAQAQAAAGASSAAGIVGATNSLSGVPLSLLLANQGSSAGGGAGSYTGQYSGGYSDAGGAVDVMSG